VQLVLDAWPELPEAIRRGIVAIIAAVLDDEGASAPEKKSDTPG